MTLHKSVLLKESIELLNIRDKGIYVDCTLGYAGHSSEILKRVSNGYLYAFDQDEYARNYSEDILSNIGNNYKIIASNFASIKEELSKLGVSGVDGILFDLGVSSVQLDDEKRGFSFHKDAKLDMRMDTSQEFSAYDVVNSYSYIDLVRIFREYGEEKYATSIAKKIVDYRNTKNIETTLELVDIIKSGMPMKAMRDSHPARRIFQAIRIEVNKELDVLEIALRDSLDILNVGGRVAVIAFQSLEDKIVKRIFKEYSEIDKEMAKLPFVPEEYLPKYKIICKGLIPSDSEIEENNRSRSSRLRVIERIKE